MKYELWGLMADGNEFIPSTKEAESDDFMSIYWKFLDRMDDRKLCVIVANIILNVEYKSKIESEDKIYESPDGETIFERTMGNYIERKQIK